MRHLGWPAGGAVHQFRVIGQGITLALLALLIGCVPAYADQRLTSLVSTGPSGGNGLLDATYAGASADGSHVYFTTKESLVPADTDSSQDVYERYGNAVTLISTGPGGGNGPYDAFFDGASADGSRVSFTTGESLVSADTDSQYDIYQRSGGITTWISIGPSGGVGPFAAYYEGTSQDGRHVFFTTDERVVSGDTDTATDLYDRNDTTTTELSTGQGSAGNSPFPVRFAGASQDGSHVFFTTYEQLAPGDADSQGDIYEHSGTTTTLVSTGSNSNNWPYNAIFGGNSADGSRVFLTTQESLVLEDNDAAACSQLGSPTACADVYDRSGGTTTLMSAGGNGGFDAAFDSASQDGSRVFFTTAEGLAPSDTDNDADVYQRAGGTTTEISLGPSGGNGAFDASYAGGSQDGSHVFFATDESLVPADTDGRQDVYERSGSTTTRVSTGPSGGNTPFFDASFAGASADGSRVFFTTDESLVPADTDGRRDIYERYRGATTLISTGPVSGFNLDNYFAGSSADGTRVFFRTYDQLVPSDTDGAQDVYQARVVPYQTPSSAGAITTSLVPVFKQCGTSGNPPTGTHAAPFSAGSCNPAPSALAAYAGINSTGSVTLGAVAGDPTTTADEADVLVMASIADVRAGSTTGPDYNPNTSGEDLTIAVKLRLTDLFSGASQADPATATDFDFGVPVDCGNTAGSEGATCSANTSAEAATPGFVGENHRTVLQAFRVRVSDSGSDGIRGNADDKLFEQQGVFEP